MITKAERDEMLSRLESTRQLVHRTVHGLTPAQLQYCPASDRWSIAENLEHIALVEQRILAGLKRTFDHPPDMGKKPALADDQLFANFGRVVQPLTAPELLRPTSRWQIADLLNEFEVARRRIIEFAAAAADSKELRQYFMPHPFFGELDGYQWLILAAGHSVRHCNQCDSVKQSPGFPR
jgi:hypothetical protein